MFMEGYTYAQCVLHTLWLKYGLIDYTLRDFLTYETFERICCSHYPDGFTQASLIQESRYYVQITPIYSIGVYLVVPYICFLSQCSLTHLLHIVNH